MSTVQTQAWTGFGKNTEVLPAPSEGAWLGYLYRAEQGDWGYGPAVRLTYNLFVPSSNGTIRYTQSEILSLPDPSKGESLNSQNPVFRRLCAVNGVEPSVRVNPATILPKGYGILHLKRNGNYLRIQNVESLPHGFEIPDDVKENPDVPAQVERFSEAPY